MRRFVLHDGGLQATTQRPLRDDYGTNHDFFTRPEAKEVIQRHEAAGKPFRVAVRIRVRPDARGAFTTEVSEQIWRIFFTAMEKELQEMLKSRIPLSFDMRLSFDAGERESRVGSNWARIGDLRNDISVLNPQAVVLMAGADRGWLQVPLHFFLKMRMLFGGPPVYYSIGASRAGGQVMINMVQEECSATNLRKVSQALPTHGDIAQEATYLHNVGQFLPSALNKMQRAQVLNIIREANEALAGQSAYFAGQPAFQIRAT